MSDIVQIRASSLGTLFDCPARWEATQIKKIYMPTSSAAILGTAVHAGTALFDASKIEGNPLSIDDTRGAVVDAIHKPDEDVVWGDDSPNDAEKIALGLHAIYCEQIAPTQEYVAVEATCQHLEIADIGIALTGTVDRVYVDDGGHYDIADIKTGKAAVNAQGVTKTQGHAAQMAVYELLAQHSTGEKIDAPAKIIGLQVAKTTKGQRAGVGEISNAMELLVGTEEQEGLLEVAAKVIHSGLFFGNVKSMMCHEKYCPIFGSCKWRK